MAAVLGFVILAYCNRPLARPENFCNYGEQELFALAAAYAAGIARNHPFIDGNKHKLTPLPVSFCM